MKSIVTPSKIYEFIAPFDMAETRLDSFIKKVLPHYSRTFFQKLIQGNHITVNGAQVKQSLLLKPADRVLIEIPAEKPLYDAEVSDELKAAIKNLDVQIVYENKDFYILNKPAGLTVHKPSSYATDVTLVDWLLLHSREIEQVGHPDRPGIVHRLDKDTSGLIIIPRNNYAHTIFSDLFKNRQIKKTYLALVEGHPEQKGSIDLPIGRDPHVRNKMSIHGINARASLTHYRVVTYLENASLIELYPVTGRTHQIRVHCAAIGHSLIGDQVYGKKSSLIDRHALHATGLQFTYETINHAYNTQLPEDFSTVLAYFKWQT